MLKTFERRKLRVRKSLKDNNKSGRNRIVVTRSNKNIYAQIVDVSGKVLAQESSLKLEDKISGVEKAKIIGKKLAQKCKDLKIQDFVFDKGSYNYNGRVKALAEACRENGLKF